jgi:hypothetical protein
MIERRSNAVQLPDQIFAIHLQLSHELHIAMSNILELNCWVLGDDARSVFPVEVANSKTVGTLKKAIKDEMEHSFDNLDAKSLVLWKVSCPI